MPDQRRTKLDDKSKKYTFIEYDERTKAFRLFDLIERKVIVSRDVHVNEESVWNWNNQNKNNSRGRRTINLYIYNYTDKSFNL
jgi:hypothetical protein